MAAMDPDLMRPSRFEQKFHHRVVLPAGKRSVMGYGARTLLRDLPLDDTLPVTQNRRVDFSGERRGRWRHCRKIILSQLSVFSLSPKHFLHITVSGGNDNSRRVLVQTPDQMDVRINSLLLPVPQQIIRQGTALMPAGRMHDGSRRLIHDKKCVVLIKDVQLVRLWLDFGNHAPAIEQSRNLLSRLGTRCSADRRAVEQNAAVVF